MGNDVRVRASVIDNVSGPLGKIRDQFKLLGDKQTRTIAAGNLAAMGMAKGFSLAGAAVGRVADFLGDAVRGAMEDEVATRRLTEALRANVKGWDGSTAAIDRAVKARQSLGFTDDDLTNSLSALVAATGNVNKALDIQSVAIDLARFKNISLQDASEALVKVEAGQFRVLKSLGIVLRDGATQTEALAAVQKVAAGQGEAYSKTTAGSIERMQSKWDAFADNVGKKATPIIEAIADIGSAFIETADDAPGPRETEGVKALSDALTAYAQAQVDAGTASLSAADAAVVLEAKTRLLGGSLGDTTDREKAARRAARDLNDVWREQRRVVTDLGKGLEGLKAPYDDLLDRLYGHDKAAGDVAQAQRDLDDLLAEAKGLKRGSQEWVILQGKIAEAKQRLFDYQFLQKQAEGPTALLKWLKEQQKAFGSLGTTLDGLIAKLTYYYKIADPAYIDRLGGVMPKPGEARAAGGPVAKGEAYLVGEKGPELFVPSAAGNVIPNNALLSGSGSAPGFTVSVNVGGGVMTPGAARELGTSLGPAIAAYLQRQGLIARAGSPIVG